MNVFSHISGEKELITAPLDGTILAGVTRDTILKLAESWKEFKVSARPYTIHELLKAQEEGRLLECFGAGKLTVNSNWNFVIRNFKEISLMNSLNSIQFNAV